MASAVAVATVAAAVAAGTEGAPEMAIKGDRLPVAIQVDCAGADCTPPVPPSYHTTVEHDRAAGLTTLTRVPAGD